MSVKCIIMNGPFVAKSLPRVAAVQWLPSTAANCPEQWGICFTFLRQSPRKSTETSVRRGFSGREHFSGSSAVGGT